MTQFPPSSAKSKVVIWGMIIAAVSICISCAPFNREVMKNIDENVRIVDVQQMLDQIKGKKVIWGGIIVETENRTNETRIIIMKTALDLQKRPVNLDQSEGRFILKQSDFLDPVIYSKGREITAIGEVEGIENLPLGQGRYDYPIIKNSQSVLWEKFEGSYPDYYFYGPFWRWGYQPFWGYYRYRH